MMRISTLSRVVRDSLVDGRRQSRGVRERTESSRGYRANTSTSRAPDDGLPVGRRAGAADSSPSNRASRLSPQSFAQYLSEPWYQILTEWDQIELEEPEELDEGGTLVSQDVLVKRDEDDSWTVVNWQMSRHSGRWLMDALTIN